MIMGDADITLRHITRRYAEALARPYAPEGAMEVLGWADTQLTGLELRPARGDLRLERLPRLVRRLADLPALGGLELGDAAQEVRELGLAPEEAHAQLLEGGRARCCADGRFGLGPDGVDAVDHAAVTLEIS